MELRYQMTDIIPLLPIPQPPFGKSSYNIPCPLCDRPGTRDKHLNINLKRNVFRCPKCGQFEGGVFDLYAYYADVPRDKVLEECNCAAARRCINLCGERKPQEETAASANDTSGEPRSLGRP